MKLHDTGVYLVNGVPQTSAPAGVTEADAKKGTIAYGILKAHNTGDSMQDLRMKFDSMTSHDITYVGIIQTARASGMKEFPLPYVMTNCHNSLCAVGGTINEDDHQFALSAAHKYGGIYVPPNMAVIHSYNREMMSGCGRMILGSDSHTRYGALGTMAVGEGGGELAKQLVGRTYDVARPGVVAIYLTGKPAPGVGPHDVALALVVGSFISAGTLTADFVRFGRNAKLAVLVAMVAFFLGNSLMFIFGAAGAAALGMADISDVMIAQGLLLPAIVVLGLNIWTTNDNALYASGLGFANITGMSSKTLSVINGIIGTVCALWLYNNFVGWLTFLSAAIPPVGGVIIADYLMNRRRYEHFATTRMMSVNWVAILAVALGIAAGHWLPGIVPVNAVLGGALSYLILNPILNRKTTAAMTHVEANSVE